MALSLLTVKTVLLFAVWLPIAAYIGFGLSNLGWVYVPASSLFVPVSPCLVRLRPYMACPWLGCCSFIVSP